MAELDHATRLKIIQEAHAAMDRGDEAEYIRISQQIPLAPHLAKAAKDIFGVDYLKQSGFDLSKAEEKYGHNWLNQ